MKIKNHKSILSFLCVTFLLLNPASAGLFDNDDDDVLATTQPARVPTESWSKLIDHFPQFSLRGFFYTTLFVGSVGALWYLRENLSSGGVHDEL